MNPLLHLKKAIPPFVVLFVLTWVVLSPEARGVCQEGCLTNSNTVLGDNALVSNTGSNNTAIGSGALVFNNTGSVNTATGSGALFFNTTGSYNTATGAGTLQLNTTGGFMVLPFLFPLSLISGTGGLEQAKNLAGGRSSA